MRALACLYLVAISAACTYTTVNNPPLVPIPMVAGGPPGAPCATPGEASEEASVAVASSSGAQVCPEGSSCNLQCDQGNCAFECAEGSTCNIQCDGGNCTIDVAAGATANVQCDGGHCTDACAGGATCDFQCDGGACSAACGTGSTCNFDCNTGDCVTRAAS